APHPGEPADASAEGEADDADVGVAPAERDQAGAVEGIAELAPLDAGAGGDGAAYDVDLDAPQGTGAQQERVVEGGAWGMACRLDAHRDAVDAGPADRGDHVGRVGDLEHRGGVLLDVDDPGHAGGGEGRVVGSDEGAGDLVAQRPEVGAPGVCGG